MPEPKFNYKLAPGKSYKELLREKAEKDPAYKSYVNNHGELEREPTVTPIRDPYKPKYPYGRAYNIKKPID